MDQIVSRPYRPSDVYCCEACTFLRGNHADWCPKARPRRAELARALPVVVPPAALELATGRDLARAVQAATFDSVAQELDQERRAGRRVRGTYTRRRALR